MIDRERWPTSEMDLEWLERLCSAYLNELIASRHQSLPSKAFLNVKIEGHHA
jgi:hypothetical protein